MVFGRHPLALPLFSCCWLTAQEANAGEWLPLRLLCLLPCIICSHCLHFLRQFEVIAMGISLFQKASLPTSTQGCFFLLEFWLNSIHPQDSSKFRLHPYSIPSCWNTFSCMLCHYLASLCIFLLVLCISSTRLCQAPTNSVHRSGLYFSGLATPELHNDLTSSVMGPWTLEHTYH